MSARPPRGARWLIERTAAPELRDPILGDMEEEFLDRVDRSGSAAAGRWYWRQALRSALPNIIRRGERAGAHVGGGGGMDGWWRDVRYALRTMARRPVFAATVALTLALGIAANTVTFSAVEGIILDPFPFPEPDRVVAVGTAYPRLDQGPSWFENASPAEYEDVRDGASTLQDVVAFDIGNRQITGSDGPPQNVRVGFWWGDPLRTVGMDAHLGRGFTDDEVLEGAAAAMLTHRLWVQQFGADTSMVGGAISVNGEPHTLVGIVPEGVIFYGTDLWTVMPVSPGAYPRGRRQFQVLGRVAQGATLETVNAELEGIARGIEAEYGAEFPEYAGWSMEARTWTDVNVSDFRGAGLILSAAVGFLLLLVCTNVANMLLARAQGRKREIAVRTALGAGRGRILRQLLTESLVLATAGGLVGLGLAALGIRGLARFLAQTGLPLPGGVRMDGTVLAFTAAVTLVAGVLFGLAPALQSLRRSTGTTLRSEGGSSTGSRSRQALQRTFVAVEVALALVLLVGGGLLTNSLVRLSRVDPGFDADHLLTMRLTVPPERYSAEETQIFFQELSRRVGELPGVRGAAAALQYPGLAAFRRNFTPERSVADEGDPVPRALATIATRGYFEAVGIPIVRGRAFSSEDGPGALPVAVLNESAARLLFPDEDPLGRRVRLGGPEEVESPWFEIVGIAADVRNRGLDQPPEAEVYASQEQIGEGSNQLFLLVRTVADPRAVLPAVRATVQEMDPEQPVYAVSTARERYAQANGTRRATALVLGLFSAFALILASAGIYAVVSYAVSERTREIGLRMALGAERGEVRRLVVRQALLPVALGAAAGLGLSIVVGRGVGSVLYEVSGTDPATLAAVTALLLTVASAASWLPARRASRLDPMKALRMD